jgi:hypothetical protein
MGIAIAGFIILIGSCAIMCVLQGSKMDKKFIEWVNK